MQMGETDLLRVDPEREGESVAVESTQAPITQSVFEGYVDDDGIIRQRDNGAAFNGAVYEVREE